MRQLKPFLVVTLLSALALTGCSAAVAARNKTPYPAEVANNFMNACMPKSTRSKCWCLFKQMQDAYTYQEFLQIDKQAAQTGTFPGLEKFVEACKWS